MVRAQKGEKERVGKGEERIFRVGRRGKGRVAGSLGWLGNRQKEAGGGW